MRLSVDDFKSNLDRMKFDGRFPVIPIMFEDVEAFLSLHSFLMETSHVLRFKETLGSIVMDPVLKVRENLKREKGSFYIPWIIPLLWFNPEILLRLYNLELPNSQTRVYIPVLGLDDEALKLLNDAVKREKLRRDTEPIWIGLSESKLVVESLDFEEIPTSIYEKLLKRKEELLEYFENKDVSTRISISFPLRRKFAFGVEYVRYRNVKEFLEKKYNFRVPIGYNKNDGKYWKKLAEDISKKTYMDFMKYLKHYLNIFELNLDVFERCDDDYSSWIIYAFLRERPGKFGCLEDLAVETDSFQEFFKKLWIMPFEKRFDRECLKIRRDVLKKIGELPPTDFIGKLKESEDEVFIKSSVGSEIEKPMIVERIGKMIKKNNFDVSEEIFEFLDEVYPELLNYLEIVNFDVPRYFKDYVLHKISGGFNLAGNIDIDISEYGSRDGKLNSVDENTEIFYIDGMGVEWVGFLMKELSGYITDFEIAQANIPTISQYNVIKCSDKKAQELSEMKFSKKALDETLHEEKYPMRIVKSLEIMKDLTEVVKNLIKEKESIVLTSDHGFTAFFSNERVKTPEDDSRILYSGRIAQVNNPHNDTENYMYCETPDGNKYVVMKNHKLFKGGKRPNGETHGGATPEEILVPILRLSIRPEGEYKAELMDRRIRRGMKLKIKIFGRNISKVSIVSVDENIEITGRRLEKDVFEFDTRKLKSGKKNMELKVNGRIIETFEIEIVSGFEEEDVFDGEI